MATFNLGNLRQGGDVYLGDHSRAIGSLPIINKTIYDVGADLFVRSGESSMVASGSIASRLIASGDMASARSTMAGDGKRSMVGGGDLSAGASLAEISSVVTQAIRASGDLMAQPAEIEAVIARRLTGGGDLVSTDSADVEVSFSFYGRWEATSGQAVVWTPVTTQRN